MNDIVTSPTPSSGSAAATPFDRPTHIVGIGASAGGLEALERFFEQVPAQSGLAFVVIQHLSPDFKSLTDELLARRTPVPIYRVQDGMEVRRDAVYLIPPKKDMIITNGRLLLTDKDPTQVVALPIDHFFRSLAQDAGDRAIGIVLSGTGSDGSRGIRDIHEASGLVLAQSPESAKFDGMPNSAVKTGVVDLILPPEQMPNALLKYAKHPLGRDLHPAAAEPVPETAMDVIFRRLRDAYGIDFSHYKPETVMRRTERRLLLNQSADLQQYVDRLSRDPEELNSLYRDLLIGVTRFFRDKDAFDRLVRDILPSLLRDRGREEELRLWCAGCATGEEAYSLAICVHECFENLGRPVNAKIFATDVHRASLDFAGAGDYPETSLIDVSPDRLRRYFSRKGDGYQVSQEVRASVVFAHHNVIKDAPFTKIDLISCRNLLIYFQPAVQRKVLSLFHFGLRPSGVLFLGPSESPGELSDEFDTLDPRWKMYRKRREIRLPAELRLPMAAPVSARPGEAAATRPVPPAHLDPQILACYDRLLDEYMPPSFLVNEKNEILHCFGGASRFLKLHDGRFSTDLLEMIDAPLKIALTGALPRARKEQTPVAFKGLRVQLPEGEKIVNVSVKPLVPRKRDTVHALVCLEENDPPAPALSPMEEIDLGQASKDHILTLEGELRYAKENLQATVEELETSNEELQATNEELVASNEELQSTNEELHSVNEELYTVNAEYQKKIAELTEMTADMDNLLASTQVHTIFLDRELRIRKFTPKIADTFNLLPQDLGRRIDSFTHGIDHPSLMEDLKRVLETGEPFEKQVQDRRGNWFLLRLMPYMSGAAAEGVLLTMVDINNLKRAEDRAHVTEEHLHSVLRHSPNPIYLKDLHGRYLLTDESFRRLVGCDPVGKTVHDLFPPDTAQAFEELERAAIAEGVEKRGEIVLREGDRARTFLVCKFPNRDTNDRLVGVSALMTDVTQLTEAERTAREAVAQRDRFLALLSHELRNPLAAILNATTLLKHLNLPADALPWSAVIERRARHMSRLLDDLLDVARITQNKIEIRRQVCDLGAVMEDALEVVRARFQEKNLRLHVSKPDHPCLVDGDPDRLQQMQVNLLLNAAKYTPEDGTVTLSLEEKSGQAVLKVTDTGVGIPPEMLERIFELFVQAPAGGNQNNEGIGVGLTLVRAIVDLHGGSVQAASAGPGQGSEFTIRLPLTDKPAPAPLQVVSVEKTATQVSPRILIVEDDADIRDSLQTLCKLDGYPSATAPDAAAALRRLADEVPDLALIDIGLPGMNGYELAREIRRQFPDNPIRLVALTGYGRPADRERAFAAGFDAHLTKPLKPGELYRVLEDWRDNRLLAVTNAEKP